MRGVFVLLLLMLAALVPMASASLESFSSEYDIVDDKILVTISVTLEPNSSFEWSLPADAEQLDISGIEGLIDSDELSSFGTLRALPQATSLEFSYVTGSHIEVSSDYFFILDLSSVESAKKTVLVKLPETAVLKYPLGSANPSIIPKTKDVLTDGRRIIVRWTEKDLSANQAFLIIYDKPTNGWLVFAIIMLAILAAGTGAAWYFVHRRARSPAKKGADSRKKGEAEGQMQGNEPESTAARGVEPEKILAHAKNSELTRNLFEEEKLIVEALLAEPLRELWQKQLENKTGLNKVRLSRKLRHLEAKGLIEKVPYGNTNKIRLKQSQ